MGIGGSETYQLCDAKKHRTDAEESIFTPIKVHNHMILCTKLLSYCPQPLRTLSNQALPRGFWDISAMQKSVFILSSAPPPPARPPSPEEPSIIRRCPPQTVGSLGCFVKKMFSQSSLC